MKKISYAIPHAVIIISAMYWVFYIIDIFNTAMHFIDNVYTLRLFALYVLLLLLMTVRYLLIVSKAAKSTVMLILLPCITLSCAMVLTSLLVINLADPYIILFSRFAVKTVIFVVTIVSIWLSVLLIAVQRKSTLLAGK